MTKAGGTSYSSHMGGGSEVNPLSELVKFFSVGSDFTLPSIGLAVLEKVADFLPGSIDKYMEMATELRKKLVELIGDNGVMLFPSYSMPAPLHGQPLLLPFDWAYTSIINAMEMPSTQIPLGLNKDGLPLGVQAVGVHGNDALTIALAVELEKEFGGWVPPDLSYVG